MKHQISSKRHCIRGQQVESYMYSRVCIID